MKKILIAMIAAALILSLAACQPAEESYISVTTLPSFVPTAPPEPTVSPTEEASTTVEPTVEPTTEPTSEGFAPDSPDHAGSGDTLFDIYESRALADLDGDGTGEEIELKAGTDKSTVYINGEESTISIPGLGQLFAVTDVDKGDKYLELVFTDKYDSGLADTEFPYSYVYWYNGSNLASMGKLLDVKFAGSWRSGFSAKKYFKANGEVYCLACTTELTNLWYMKQLKPGGSGRKLGEKLYPTKPVGTPDPLKVKAGKKCLLLAHGDSDYFKNSDLWNYAKFPHNAARAKNPAEGVILVAQSGETLKIVGVLGPNWVKLQTSDDLKGWIKIVKGKVQGYKVPPADIFDGIVSAG